MKWINQAISICIPSHAYHLFVVRMFSLFLAVFKHKIFCDLLQSLRCTEVLNLTGMLYPLTFPFFKVLVAFFGWHKLQKEHLKLLAVNTTWFFRIALLTESCRFQGCQQFADHVHIQLGRFGSSTSRSWPRELRVCLLPTQRQKSLHSAPPQGRVPAAGFLGTRICVCVCWEEGSGHGVEVVCMFSMWFSTGFFSHIWPWSWTTHQSLRSWIFVFSSL